MLAIYHEDLVAQARLGYVRPDAKQRTNACEVRDFILGI
jgi:hypothetical protein